MLKGAHSIFDLPVKVPHAVLRVTMQACHDNSKSWIGCPLAGLDHACHCQALSALLHPCTCAVLLLITPFACLCVSFSNLWHPAMIIEGLRNLSLDLL